MPVSVNQIKKQKKETPWISSEPTHGPAEPIHALHRRRVLSLEEVGMQLAGSARCSPDPATTGVDQASSHRISPFTIVGERLERSRWLEGGE
jgi:hypothetical protein